jgi:hypothetical protein
MCRWIPEILGRSGWAAAALTFAVLGASPGEAGLIVDPPAPRTDFFSASFDLSDSTLSFGGLNIANGMGASPVTLSQVGVPPPPVFTSTLFTGDALIVEPTLFMTRLVTRVDCVGAQCPLFTTVGMIQFPIVTSTSMSNDMGPFFFTLDGLIEGRGVLGASIVTMSGPLAVTINIRGRQVPEPTEAGLLLCAALAMCGAVAVGRLRAE